MRSTFAAALLMTTLFSACATPPDLTALETAVTTREARLPASLASGDFGLAVRQALTISPMLGRGQAALREWHRPCFLCAPRRDAVRHEP
jgi:hypothetical protein